MKGKISDYNKLIVIAETYYYLKGDFTPQQLYNFIIANGFKFHSQWSAKQISLNLRRSSKFKINNKKFEVIA